MLLTTSYYGPAKKQQLKKGVSEIRQFTTLPASLYKKQPERQPNTFLFAYKQR